MHKDFASPELKKIRKKMIYINLLKLEVEVIVCIDFACDAVSC